jgi:predicted patatin/cPLA2 family phospholipase
MTHSRALRITIFPAIAALTLAACAQRRPVETEEALLARRAELQQQVQSATHAGMEDLARYAHAKIQGQPGAAVDVLVVSGGGDWGAFGTGFLLGWGETASQADRRPTFDVVSGVSTGALIAPFAFLGTTADLETVDGLYRNPKDDWVRQRGLLFFMPDNASFAEVPGLEREVDSFINMDFARRVADESIRGRMLFINTTNLDDGSQLPFRWGLAAQRAVKDGDIRRLQNILLASSGIPGAFPPRQVDSWLLVDGAVTSNIIYGGAMRREDSFGASWRRLYPQQPMPKLRYWVVLNNYAVAQPRTVQPTWPSVIERSLEVAVRASTTVALRHLYAMAEVTRLRGDGETEVRWVAIPNSWKAPVEGIFKEPTMRSLSDLGRAMGRDPASWKTESP